MKEKIHHFALILLVLLMVVGGISIFLNNASYNPNFSVIDAITGATKRSKRSDDKSETVSVWKYSMDDIALSEKNYIEESIVTPEGTYKVLKNTASIESTDHILLLSDKGNKEYQKAVQNITESLENQGYQIQIKECSETMMLSLVHAGHFYMFVMSEEDTP